MFIALVVLSVLIAAMLTMSALIKITRREPMVQAYAKLGVPDSWLTPLGAVLLAGAAGLLIGLWWAPIGIAAAIGLILYFIGGVGYHAKAKDWKNIATPVVILVLSVVVLMLRIATT